MLRIIVLLFCLSIIRQHQMHEMQTTATDVPVCQSVCQAASLVLNVQKRLNGSRFCLGWRLFEGPRNIALDGNPDPARRGRSAFNAAFAKLIWPQLFQSIILYLNYLDLVFVWNKNITIVMDGPIFTAKWAYYTDSIIFRYKIRKICLTIVLVQAIEISSRS